MSKKIKAQEYMQWDKTITNNKALEALEHMCEFCHKQIMAQPSKGDLPHKMCPFRHITGDYCQKYDIIEKALKALEIIKEKGNPYLICDKNEYFLLIDVGLIRLDKEEFELLKEVLL